VSAFRLSDRPGRRPGYAAEMPAEEGGFTVRGDSRYIRESLLIESGLATALDDNPGEPFEAILRLDAEGVRAQADRVASVEGAEAARRLSSGRRAASPAGSVR